MSATIETAINAALASQPRTTEQLASLHGKRLILFLDVLPQGITLVFSDKIDVLSGPATFSDAKASVDSDTCIIQTQAASLDKLKDTSQLTQLIQNKSLSIIGDITIAQQIGDMAKSVNIDIEEWLAKNTTDVFAHSVVSVAKSTHAMLLNKVSLFSAQMADVVLEEKPIAARKQAIDSFCIEVAKLRDDTARIEARLKRLEQQCD
ncbi:ubiquinone biosynthesis accessory factor UbiJ [Alteromonas sediminis]|uniref:ubiquinone biosynthesis accessory factor UbiJ n=1 Tax=Alteromonas sediminis TaxID=2259342 RepID=UPI001404B929|nr:SCP2 sterol-binding domain-containing protein [Alteromonas sediminis]